MSTEPKAASVTADSDAVKGAALPPPYYADEWVTLYHADCAAILPNIDRKTVALVLADPPYGIKARTDSTAGPRGGARLGPGTSWPRVYGDDQPFDPAPLLTFPKVCLFGANHYADKLPSSACWLVWDKVDDLPRKRDVGFCNQADIELAWTNFPGPARLFSHRWMGYFRKTEERTRLHPTQKPVVLMRWIIRNWTKPGDLVLDPYMGSGPIAQAARDLRRRYIGIELNESYCAAAVGRLAQETLDFGETA